MFADATSFNGDVSAWDTSSATNFVSQQMYDDVPQSEQHQPSGVLHVTVFCVL
jgi:surface protein